MKLIQTKDYLLLIDEEAEIKENGWRVDLKRNSLGVIDDDLYYNKAENKNNFALVKAYYPLTEEAKELDLPLLPNPFEDLFNITEWAKEEHKFNHRSVHELSFILGCEVGYEKAQSKQFSLEDMKKALSEAFKAQQEGYNITTDEIIQSLSTQQLPKEFIPDYDIVHTDHAPNGFEKLLKFKTNSEGKEEIQGTYKY